MSQVRVAIRIQKIAQARNVCTRPEKEGGGAWPPRERACAASDTRVANGEKQALFTHKRSLAFPVQKNSSPRSTMSTVLIVPDKHVAKTEPISESVAGRAIFTGVQDRVVTPAKEKITVAATDHLMVTTAELGALRNHVVNHRTYETIPDHVLENTLLLKCIDLVSGASDQQEAFLRALPVAVDGSKKSNLSYKADGVHCIKLSLLSLVSIKAALAADVYDQASLAPQDVEKLAAYFALVPESVDLDLESKKVVDAYEKEAKWRITTLKVTPAAPAKDGNPAADEVVEYTAGFSESSVNLKRHSCGERPATKVAKRAREEEEKDERLEQSEKVACLFKSVVDVPGARYFTFDGQYDMSKLMVVEDAEGFQSLMIPFAK